MTEAESEVRRGISEFYQLMNFFHKMVLWGYSSDGRASALHAEGQRFDSVYLH